LIFDEEYAKKAAEGPGGFVVELVVILHVDTVVKVTVTNPITF